VDRPIDSQRSKVYKAEDRCFRLMQTGTTVDPIVSEHTAIQVTAASAKIDGLNHCLIQLERWISHTWFRERWPNITKINLANGAGSRRATGTLWYGNTARIKLPIFARNKWVMLHELAHVVTPKNGAAHGREYCANYLLLVQHYLGRDVAKLLRHEFQRGRVQYKPKIVMSEKQLTALRERFAKVRMTSIAAKDDTHGKQ